MTAISFDTLKYAKRLKEAGFTDTQAEALAAAQAEIIEDNVATKRDLKELEACVKRDLMDMEHRLTAKLYKALLVQTFALAGIFGVIVKLL